MIVEVCPMILRRLVYILLIAMILSLTSVVHSDQQTQTNQTQTQTQINGDEKQLEAEIQALLLAVKAGKDAEVIELNKRMLLPDPQGWFKNTFGDEAGANLAEGYKKWAKEMKSDMAVKELKMVQDSGRSEVVIKEIVATGDPGHYQDQILSTMVMKPQIYQIRLIKHGSPGEFFNLGFFTIVDGSFRNIGDLKAVRK